MNHDPIGSKMQEHYEAVWCQDDPWDFATSTFDQERYERQFALLRDRRYDSALDIGCGSGQFSERLAAICDRVLALDIAPSAIARAQERCVATANVQFKVANVMEYDPAPDGPWDLIVMSESIYCLGWLYPLFDVGWRLSVLKDALRVGGRFLMVNTVGHESDYLLLPWLINTYRDLVQNIGLEIESEQTFSGVKNSVPYDVMTCLFRKP